MPITLSCQCCKKVFVTRKRSGRIIRFCSKKCAHKIVDIESKNKWKNIHEGWKLECPSVTLLKMKERFEKFFEKKEGCWKWQGAKKSYGKKLEYGCFSFRNRKTVGAHRISYEIYKGDIPKGKIVMHICDNPPCVNPNHLKLGTYLENQRDKMKKGRGKCEKLSIENIKEIKKRLEMGIGKKRLASDFKVSRQTIYSIQKGKTWSDIIIE